MLYLTSEETAKLISVDEMNNWVESAYRQLGNDEATDSPREIIDSDELAGNMKVLAAAGRSGLGGFVYTGGGFTLRENSEIDSSSTSKLAYVFDDANGELLCLIDADRLSWLRTGATSAIATKYCATEEAAVFGLIGSGRQAMSQLLAVSTVRDFDEVRVFSPTKENREQFVKKMQDKVSCSVVAVDAAKDAVVDSDVISTATTSNHPVIDGEWLRPGTHVNAIGAHYPNQREIDTVGVQRGRVIVDSINRAQKEEGELIIPAQEEKFEWDDVIELGDIVAGNDLGRNRDDDITYMGSGGLAIEVLVPAREIYRKATENDIGTTL